MGKNQKRQNRSRGRRTSPGGDISRPLNPQKIAREFSSGGVVYKSGGTIKDNLWLVRSTKPSKLFPKSYWTLPKGWIDDAGNGIPGPIASGMKKATQKDLEETAIREVSEEGGVKAKIIKKIGTHMLSYIHPTRGKILKFVTFYLMQWESDLPQGHDGETDEVLWLQYEDAYKKLSFGNEKQMLKKAKEILEKQI